MEETGTLYKRLLEKRMPTDCFILPRSLNDMIASMGASTNYRVQRDSSFLNRMESASRSLSTQTEK